MINDILNMMEERKEIKHRDPVQYKALNKNIHEACRTTKEEWFKDQCEDLEIQFRLREMHNNVSKQTGKHLKEKLNGCIVDKNGKLPLDKEEIAARVYYRTIR